MALLNGVDLVLELPVCFSTASAEYFAHGAVSILDKLGVVDFICFGSECGDINILETAADLLLNNSTLFDEGLQACLKEGMTYPAARTAALLNAIKSNSKTVSDTDKEMAGRIINEPNNILGIEYIKALKRLNSDIRPVTIRRISAGYHDRELADVDLAAYETADNNLDNTEGINSSSSDSTTSISSAAISSASIRPASISSATAIRASIMGSRPSEGDVSPAFDRIKSSVPDNVYDILKERYLKSFPVTEDDLSLLLYYRLLYEDRDSLTEYMDVSGDLADRIKNLQYANCDYEEFCKRIKSRNYTLTRINRALLHIILNIRKNSMQAYCSNGYTQYARILGLRKDSSGLLRMIYKNGRLPVITKLSRAEEELDKLGLQMLAEDINASHLYNSILYSKYQTDMPNEYRQGICII